LLHWVHSAAIGKSIQITIQNSIAKSQHNAMTPTTTPVPDLNTVSTLLRGTIEQIQFARTYTLSLLEEVPRERWFEIPAGLPSNIAWQAGHLAVSQYGLLMFRVRGRRPEDLDLIPGKFRKAYSRQTTPNSDPANQPSPYALIERLAQIHELALAELSEVPPEVLLEEVDRPWAAWPNKLGAIMFCPLHEHIHAGQIGLIRRALGLDPIR
jgi:hypothetical protein